ncbi:class I SAM-dependent methyltransferase [Solidesulfovibrio sp. C21]|uniref:class I SAM-dependent methyltransferase n=1 Tax=Solidesulfovibrio sp. C21 TaxID=3398613 RepID=UPI0039FDA208
MEQAVKIGQSFADQFDEDYFERGAIVGTSGYINYSWMAELTIRMAHFLIMNLPLTKGQRVLDYGCAKGFMVKALRLLDINAYGVDISDYAVSNTPTDAKPYCCKINSVADPNCFSQEYDWLLSKDVFEHISVPDISLLLRRCRKNVAKMFIVVPLGIDDVSNKFIIPEYDKDVTHITIKTAAWWKRLFIKCGWEIDKFDYAFKGVKENWTQIWPKGNGFFILS